MEEAYLVNLANKAKYFLFLNENFHLSSLMELNQFFT